MDRISGFIQNYAWGKVGSDSFVAQLAYNEEDIKDMHYAELWFSTHSNGHSMIHLRDESILLGEHVSDLPFILKALSVGKALSIQAHPDKKLAKELHLKFPNIYKDDNHKPELVIALTEFEMLAHFLPFSQIVHNFESIEELKRLAGHISDLPSLFTRIMTSPKEDVENALRKLIDRCNSNTDLFPNQSLFLRLHKQFPLDVGLFGVFLFNYFVLSPGDAFFIAPCMPHAYLFGDCIEVMARSDNVVRVGLTPKYIDTATLCSMLTYETLIPRPIHPSLVPGFTNTFSYSAQVDEFKVFVANLTEPSTTKLPNSFNVSVILVTRGTGNAFVDFKQCPLKVGSAFLVHQSTCVELSTDDVLQVFYCTF